MQQDAVLRVALLLLLPVLQMKFFFN